MDMIKNNVSVLKLENLYFSNFEFTRKEEFSDYSNNDLKFGIGEHAEHNDGILTVILTLQVILPNKFELKLDAIGKFKCDSDSVTANMFEKNAISIMFPYIRSEVTLLTSQPNFKPIILPTINVNALFEKIKSDNTSS